MDKGLKKIWRVISVCMLAWVQPDLAQARTSTQQDPVLRGFRQFGDAITSAGEHYAEGKLEEATQELLWVESNLSGLDKLEGNSIIGHIYSMRAKILLSAGRPGDAQYLANETIRVVRDRRPDRGDRSLDNPELDALSLCDAQTVLASVQLFSRHFDQAATLAVPQAVGAVPEPSCSKIKDVRYWALRASGKGAWATQEINPPSGKAPTLDHGSILEFLGAADVARGLVDVRTELELLQSIMNTLDGPLKGDAGGAKTKQFLLERYSDRLLRLGHTELALKAADEGLAGVPLSNTAPDPILYFRRGAALFDLGRFEEADSALNLARVKCAACAKRDRDAITVTRQTTLQILGRFAEADKLRVGLIGKTERQTTK